MAEVESAPKLDHFHVNSMDPDAFERGREFLEKAQNSLEGFKDYKGLVTPKIDTVDIKIGPGWEEMMLFMINGGRTNYYIEGYKKDGRKESRHRGKVEHVGLTEAESGILRFDPVQGVTRAILSTPLGKADPEDINELSYFVVRRTYTIKELSRLSLAVVSRDLLASE